MPRPSYLVSRLDYDLPQGLIAQHPLPGRSDSRLLHVNCKAGTITDRGFHDLPELLPQNTLCVFNNSKVIPARLFGKRTSGGKVELLFHKWLGDGVCEAVVGSNAKLKAGETVLLPEGWSCELLEDKALDGIKVAYNNGGGEPATLTELLAYLQTHGIMPLPPYIKRDGQAAQADSSSPDTKRYQTVYASQDGSVAAPTAGLHFDEAMLATLESAGHPLAYVTLHVGLGTFAPVRATDLANHEMHGELFNIESATHQQYANAQLAETPVMAVGTTSLRVLHTLQGSGQTGAVDGETRAFIYPGQGTDACRLLLTNFHLPRSTLLALVFAFGGENLMRKAYEHAVAGQYRFFSYGDCMLIDRG